MPFLQGRTISLGQIEQHSHAAPRPFRGKTDRLPDVRDSVCSRDSVPSSGRMHAPVRIESAPARHRSYGTASRRFSASHGCNMLQARSLAATLDYVPHDILRDAFPPHLSRSGNPSKDPSFCDPGCHYPLIERRLDHCGIGTVRMWPPLPIRSTTAQCPWRTWISSNSRPTSSDLRKPQPNSKASMA